MPPQRNNTTGLLIGAAGLLALLALVASHWYREAAPKLPPQAPVASTLPAASSPPATSAGPPGFSNDGLQNLFGFLKTTPDAETARHHLAELRAALSAMPTDASVAAIRQFLDSKADAPSHLGFKIAGTGLLDEAPTLRTFLLDELGRLDPAAAAEYARIILSSKDSPDEWALALRNLARGDASAEGRALLEQKAGELLQYAPWQQAPSVGFLEAFDVAVYLGGTTLLPALTEMARQRDNPATAHASYLALDRLVINDPVSTLSALQAAPESMEGREQTRANYFARGDVRDPQQRQLLQSYLLDPKISAAELETFAGLFPNANYMISANLLTENPTLERGTLANRDAESLRVVQQWLTDPNLASRRPVLEKMEQRLQGFLRQASRGR